MKIVGIALDGSRCRDSFCKVIFCEEVSAVVSDGASLFVFSFCSHPLLYLYETSIDAEFDDNHGSCLG